jgi:hypothetical protein
MAQSINEEYENVVETTALLPSQPKSGHGLTTASAQPRTRCKWPWKHVVALCIALAITADIGEYLFLAPKVRLFESVACTKHYLQENPSLVRKDGSVPEHLCKIDPVQDRVATIIGWQQFFDSIPAMLLPIPYGYLADKYGRKWIIVLSFLGYALSWASMLFIVSFAELPYELPITNYMAFYTRV